MQKNYFTINDNFEKIIHSVFPKCKRITQLTNAWTNFVFKVKVKHKEYIFRFPRNSFFAKALEKEIAFNHWVQNKVSFKTNCLKKHFHLGRCFSVHELIKGKSLGEVYDKLSRKQIGNLAKDVCNAISQLQQMKVDFKLGKLSQFLASLSTVNKGNYDFSILGPLRELEDQQLCLCHGDLNPGNIIVKKGKLIAIIDFAFVSFSAPFIDITRLIGRLPEKYKEPLLDNYSRLFGKNIDENHLNYTLCLWSYVEQDYIEYIKSQCPDIVLPKFFN